MRFIYKREAQKLQTFERWIASHAHRVWSLSEADRDGLAGGLDIPVVAIPIALGPAADLASRPSSAFDVGLLGTWSWYPNKKGLQWFLDEIYPRLPRNLSIHIAGEGASHLVRGHPGVTYRGHVQDAESFMRSCRVFVIATRFGTGIETKMLSAISSGATIVGTSIAARGLQSLPASISLSDDAEEFASLVAAKARAETSRSALESSQSWCDDRLHEFRRVLAHELDSLVRPPVRATRQNATDGDFNPRGRS
jgi:hypothetical protein